MRVLSLVSRSIRYCLTKFVSGSNIRSRATEMVYDEVYPVERVISP